MKITKEVLDKYLFNKYSLNIGAVLLGIAGIYLINFYNNYYEKRERDEYKADIVDVHTKLDGYVVDYSWSKVYAGTKLVTLSTGEKFFVSTAPYYRTPYGTLYGLLECLEEGDHLYKPGNTDSIFVTKPDGSKFFFMAYWEHGGN